MDKPIVIYGPAYLDIVVELACRLVPDLVLDQSLPATSMTARHDGTILLCGDNGDYFSFTLPSEGANAAATYQLTEPVLARLLGADTQRTLTGTYPVSRCYAQIGGMGAGYAKAFHGLLRMPLGRDDIGNEVLRQLQTFEIASSPYYIDGCSSDTSLLILSTQAEKLAVGVRQAMMRWQTTAADHHLVDTASALVFCGVPNALMAEILSWHPDIPVMCAPAMRNVCDTTVPLAELASQIDYLTLNALEWEYLTASSGSLAQIPLVSVTNGPHGSKLIVHGDEEITLPAQPCAGPVNTNRAGETYGSTAFKALLHYAPGFFTSTRLDVALAERIGSIATAQAARQLAITGFAFPPDDWMV
jgi:sugar/nucleoside kinase (ribokinase family)